MTPPPRNNDPRDDKLRALAHRGEKQRRSAEANGAHVAEREEHTRAMDSLRPRWLLIPAIAGAALVPTSVALVLILVVDLFVWGLIAAVLSLFASLAAAYVGYLKVGCRLGLKWLSRLPFEFDRDAYVNLLGGRYSPGVSLVVQLHFESSPPQADRQLMADAALGLLPESTTRWKGDGLIVTSPYIGTEFKAPYANQPSAYGNVGVHRWFRKLARQLVPPLSTRSKITRVTIKTK